MRSIIITESQKNILLKEGRGISDEVVELARLIEDRIFSEKKKQLTFTVKTGIGEVTVDFLYKNFKDDSELVKWYNEDMRYDGYNYDLNTIFLTLISIGGKLQSDDFYDSIQHECEHYWKSQNAQKSFGSDVYDSIIYGKVSSRNSIVNDICNILYFCNRIEIDAYINGAYHTAQKNNLDIKTYKDFIKSSEYIKEMYLTLKNVPKTLDKYALSSFQMINALLYLRSHGIVNPNLEGEEIIAFVKNKALDSYEYLLKKIGKAVSLYKEKKNENDKTLSEVRYIDVHNRDNRKTTYVDEPMELYKWLVNIVKSSGYVINKVNHNKENGYLYIKISPDKYGAKVDDDYIKRAISTKFEYKTRKPQIKDDGTVIKIYLPYESDSNWKPISNGEKIRVFHATDLHTAIYIAKNGISGKEIVPRTYSYENGMNPNGLFVTTDPSFSVIKYNNFGYHYNDIVVIEFTVNENNLDTPVWNGQNTFFGQGTNPEPFRNRSERVSQKLQYLHTAQGEEEWVRKSNNPAMASKIFNNSENQALYYGDLNPNMIKRFWVRKYKGDSQLENSFIPMSLKEFLKKYKDYSFKEYGKEKPTKISKEKIYMPNEEYLGEDDFAKHYADFYSKKYKNSTYDDTYAEGKEIIKDIENSVYNGNLSYSQIMGLKQIMFPKQIIGLIGVDKYRENVDKFYPEFKTKGNTV